MKTTIIAALLAGGIFLSGCEPTVVEHRYVHGGYYGYYRGYEGPYYRTYYDGDRYRTRNVDRTNVYVNNVYATNVHRNEVNRTAGTQRSSRSDSTFASAQTSSRIQARSSSTQLASTRGKGKHLKRDKSSTNGELTH